MRTLTIVLLALFVAVAAATRLDIPVPASAAASAPTLSTPADGATLPSFGPALAWTNPPGATQYHLQLVPSANDGPGIDVHVGSADTGFQVPPPPRWYGLLPDMTYTWRVRVSDAPAFVGLSDPSWGPWAERKFRTPAVSSSTITPLMLANHETATTRTPVLQWDNSRSDVFYYELELSKDPTFNTNPSSASAMVYSALLHGGTTRPAKSYQIPAGAPLEDGTVYYWRVRPRVQGDGTPVAWPSSFTFRTDTSAVPRVTVQSAVVGSGGATSSNCQAEGAGTSFRSSPLLTGLGYAYRYTGSGKVTHNWFRDDLPFLDVLQSLASGQTCFASSYGSPGGGPGAGAPLFPGAYRLEIWHAGQKLQSTSFSIIAAAGLEFGPITVGTGVENPIGCRLTSVATTFPAGTTRVHVRFNSVGAGEYAVGLARGDTLVDARLRQAIGPAGCVTIPINLPANASGSWSVILGYGGQPKQLISFTIG